MAEVSSLRYGYLVITPLGHRMAEVVDELACLLWLPGYHPYILSRWSTSSAISRRPTAPAYASNPNPDPSPKP